MISLSSVPWSTLFGSCSSLPLMKNNGSCHKQFSWPERSTHKGFITTKCLGLLKLHPTDGREFERMRKRETIFVKSTTVRPTKWSALYQSFISTPRIQYWNPWGSAPRVPKVPAGPTTLSLPSCSYYSAMLRSILRLSYFAKIPKWLLRTVLKIQLGKTWWI